MTNNKVKYLKDYKNPDFEIKNTYLYFEVLQDKIIVKSKLIMNKVNADAKELILDGEELNTISVIIDGKTLTIDKDYSIANNQLTILAVGNNFELETIVEIDPFNNTKLMGVYKSNSCLCSQCEPEGFRRITWFLDRPDVMSIYTVTIKAPIDSYRILLSNGNLIKTEIVDGMQEATFFDPYPKPSYLFAFVAGNFDCVNDSFTTKSKKQVALNVFVEEGKKDQAYFAMESLIRSMKWDEDAYNLEYDLEVFSIVAVSDFNFGAMENKSLNIFNDAYVLANSYIATDDDYFNIESIIGHEYFHNYTGDRITCRDWFQLTLKEGLTVLRDHQFSEDLHNRSVVRIANVERLRNFQFPEDASALSHPIRPTSYIEMNNFYTTTVYDKGSEVIRMIETIIGRDNFKKGIAIYFENFDGQAVTCEDFIWSMEQSCGKSLEKFKKWYLQSGTPIVTVSSVYKDGALQINLKQINKATADQEQKEALVIPLKLALFNKNGEVLDIVIAGENLGKEYTAILDSESLVLNLETLKDAVLSINRGFSAPIILQYQQSDEELITLMSHDNDGFVRYESSQKYLKKYMVEFINNLELGQAIDKAKIIDILKSYSRILENYKEDMAFTALLLNLPSFNSFEMEFTNNLPVDSIVKVIDEFSYQMAIIFEDNFKIIFNTLKDNEEEFSAEMMAIRSLKNKALSLLLKTRKEEYLKLALDFYNSTKNMTKRMGVLVGIKDFGDNKIRDEIMANFYQEYEKYATVINKWLLVSASVRSGNALNKVKSLMALSSFSYKNPNKVRHLMSGFMSNQLAFHNLDGSGYKFLEEMIIKMDKINPSISASLAKGFAKIMIHKADRQKLMKASMENILTIEDISKGLYEIVSKSIKMV